VAFMDAGVSIGSGTVDSTGAAAFSTSTLAVGDHPITAVYSGDASNATSTSSVLTQTISAVVIQAATTATV
jgi:large repetitive protein